MAIGKYENRFAPVTAWKWRCILCGAEITEIEESGIRALQDGHKPTAIFRWFSEGKANA